jgi:FKBP-type peptidyl-prolyl cis-trans isomerase
MQSLFALFCLLSLPSATLTLQQPRQQLSRRSMIAFGPAAAILTSTSFSANAASDLKFETSKSGMQYADAKLGAGQPLKLGSTATIDYVLSTTGARYGTKIFGTADTDTPYRWTLGDGSTISGVELAILGSNDVTPMLPGGIRRVVIPQSLGYEKLAGNAKTLCVQDGRPGPIPPPNAAFEEYQRFKNIYCNPARQYQPDIVFDIKLYGSRSR